MYNQQNNSLMKTSNKFHSADTFAYSTGKRSYMSIDGQHPSFYLIDCIIIQDHPHCAIRDLGMLIRVVITFEDSGQVEGAEKNVVQIQRNQPLCLILIFYLTFFMLTHKNEAGRMGGKKRRRRKRKKQQRQRTSIRRRRVEVGIIH